MADEIYADGISGIGLSRGVVKMDLATESVTEKDPKGAPKLVHRQRVVMPVDGFLRTLAAMQDMARKLQEAGVLKAVDPAAAAAAKAKKN